MTNWIVVSVEVLDKDIWHLVWSQLGEEVEVLEKAEEMKKDLTQEGYEVRVSKGPFRKITKDDGDW